MNADGFSGAIRQAAALLAQARSVVVLTGAGVSTESGIPDFRSPGGLWTRYDPRKLTFDLFCAYEATRRDYWKMSTESYPVLRDAEPNAAHHAIVAIEKAGKLLRLVTQNVDGLHRKAGSSPERTTEIHGSSLRAGCIDCGASHDREQLHRRLVAGEVVVPSCDVCGGRVKPATISFGQSMPERETAQAFEAAEACDLMLVVGSSLQVYPAAALPDTAVAAGSRLIIVNNEETPKDDIADVLLRGSAGESMSLLVRAAGLELP
ncbi:MAG TPA: Sir2 family NAD-dependent protein deacetylase [Candidatus Limnocylindrales bacterium]|nr:Sir2 family NAD-dependent protein deacetylase [Candidatus Limnocylindrales bacterium]